ncbi:NAD(P)/FAD-dependent oxidoreductase [Stratiformator vulcanicus]|uniref:NADH:ubiquinone reductase (non-electrogenic) n=1 Tax=Stratiformator vulcanicus TaxID=2527980 RepID=A0A517R5Q6_9PLAN|nr:NAD(P)/FAD-dependent oxidoreductase [Stratiformator vulcanicus]QDT39236.1 NADH dehydrogenase-like protein [Stratiformator vulcanicus]
MESTQTDHNRHQGSGQEQGKRPRVVVVGGGFGGLNAARSLRKADVDVTLIDRRNFHLFQPLLYQVATGTLSPGNIASPLRVIFRRQKNCFVRLGEVTDFDLDENCVLLGDERVPFDYLVVASGAVDFYFGNDDWAQEAPGMKSIESAIEIRREVLSAFERAENANDAEERNRALTFVIVGGGPTGVELAGAISELARHTMRNDFRRIDPSHSKIYLLDASPRVLEHYPEDLSQKAQADLERLGVEVKTKSRVTAIEPDYVEYTLDGETQRIESETVLWAAGVRASPLGAKLAEAAGVELGRGGQVAVNNDLSVEGHSNVFVIGDLAAAKGEDGKQLPGIAPVAIQEAAYLGKKVIPARIKGEEPKPFRYRDLGTMAVIGRRAAIAQVGERHFSGTIAWLMWLFIHLMQLVQFQNRMLVFVQWGWSYLTWGKTTRLITGHPGDDMEQVSPNAAANAKPEPHAAASS